MDLKDFVVSFASIEKVIGGGFNTIVDHSRKVQDRLQSLDDKYAMLRADIERLKLAQLERQQYTDSLAREAKDNRVVKGAMPTGSSLTPKLETDGAIQSPKKRKYERQEPSDRKQATHTQSITVLHAASFGKVGPVVPVVQTERKPLPNNMDQQLGAPPSLSYAGQGVSMPIGDVVPQPAKAMASPPAGEQQPYLLLIQQKIRELEQRLESSERSFQSINDLNGKKISGIFCDITETESQIRRVQHNVDLCNRRLADFENQLLDYKLKKEAKLQKLLNNTGSQVFEKTGGTDEAFKKMVIERIKQLGKDISGCVQLEAYQQDREEQSTRISKMTKDINDRVTTEAYESNLAVMASSTAKGNRLGGDGDATGFNLEPVLKIVSASSREIKETKDELLGIQGQVADLYRLSKELAKAAEQSNALVTSHGERFETLEQSIRHILENLDKTYERKVGELETAVNELREQQEKEQKLVSFQQESMTHLSEADSSIYTSRGELKKTEAMRNELQAEMSMHSKKLNKMYLASNHVKTELQRLSEQLKADLEQVRNEVDKKADHENVKRSFQFVENKLNQIVGVMVQNGQTEPDGDSLIAKKNWSCLSCDKNLDRFQGKLGEVRFTSVFPARFDSPRIGGYFRQNQADKDYKKLFMGYSDKQREKRTGSELPQVKTDRP